MEFNLEKNISLAAHTTLKVGGVADYFAEVKTLEELRAALQFAKQTATPPLILGGGSNLLVSDDGYRGLVIKNNLTGRHYEETEEAVFLTSCAGEVLDEVVADSVAQGYWGLENLSAIPGTIGATPIQNVGAYGVEVSSLITEVVAINTNSFEEKTFTNDECNFSYRDSFFKTDVGRDWLVTQVVFKLSTQVCPQLEYKDLRSLQSNKKLTPRDVRLAVQEIRSHKFPDWNKVGTAGSFFKNPIISNELYKNLQQKYPDLPGYSAGEDQTKVSLGWILDNVCDLRGYCRDGVCLYEKQALVLVNLDAKNSTVIEKFADHVSSQVKEKTGIEIEREVRSV